MHPHPGDRAFREVPKLPPALNLDPHAARHRARPLDRSTTLGVSDAIWSWLVCVLAVGVSIAWPLVTWLVWRHNQ